MKDTNNQGKSLKERLAEAEELWQNATISDIIAAKRREADSIEASARGSLKVGEDWDGRPFTESDLESALDLAETKREEANRLEAAHKREMESIHRAMVLIAGIEMESSENPPRLWTALEDAYNALSDALGTDGDTTADEEEAKSTGRHFVIRPFGDAAKLREALSKSCAYFAVVLNTGMFNRVHLEALLNMAKAALAAPQRNCDVGTPKEWSVRFNKFCRAHLSSEKGCGGCPLNGEPCCELAWAQMPYEAEEGGAK